MASVALAAGVAMREAARVKVVRESEVSVLMGGAYMLVRYLFLHKKRGVYVRLGA